jgi:hypothetical protein
MSTRNKNYNVSGATLTSHNPIGLQGLLTGIALLYFYTSYMGIVVLDSGSCFDVSSCTVLLDMFYICGLISVMDRKCCSLYALQVLPFLCPWLRSQTFLLHCHQGQNVFTNFIGHFALLNITLISKTWSYHAATICIHTLKISLGYAGAVMNTLWNVPCCHCCVIYLVFVHGSNSWM